VDYIVSAEGQRLLVEKFSRRPIRADVPPPPGAPPAATLPMNNIPVEWSNAVQKDVLARYLRLVRR
jgi:ABC-type Fe3+ transport system substrate-binding protein